MKVASPRFLVRSIASAITPVVPLVLFCAAYDSGAGASSFLATGTGDSICNSGNKKEGFNNTHSQKSREMGSSDEVDG